MERIDKRALIRVAALPSLLLVALLLFAAIYNALGLPPTERLLELAALYQQQYGYWVVLAAAIGEGLLVAGWYLPGSAVIVLSVVLCRQSQSNVVTVIAIVALGFLVASIINYALGRYGWYLLLRRFGLLEPLNRMRATVVRKGQRVILLTYFHPNIGCLSATSCGILRLPFIPFVAYSTVALLFWNALWGGIVYWAGPVMLRLLSVWFIVPALLVWILIRCIRALRQHSHYHDEGKRTL